MKKFVLNLITLVLISQPIFARNKTTFTLNVPCIHPSLVHTYEQAPKESKPEWKKFFGKYMVSLIAAASIGAVTGLGTAEVEKRWVVQKGKTSEVRWFINMIGSSLVHWNLVNLVNSGLDESDIPHDPSFLSLVAWISSWGFYLYRK